MAKITKQIDFEALTIKVKEGVVSVLAGGGEHFLSKEESIELLMFLRSELSETVTVGPAISPLYTTPRSVPPQTTTYAPRLTPEQLAKINAEAKKDPFASRVVPFTPLQGPIQLPPDTKVDKSKSMPKIVPQLRELN